MSHLPLRCVSHDNFAAFSIVSLDTHFLNILRPSDVQLLVDLILDRETMRVPTEAAFNVEATLVGPAGDHIFHGSSKDVAIVRQPSGKGRSIIKGVPESDNIIRVQGEDLSSVSVHVVIITLAVIWKASGRSGRHPVPSRVP